MAVIQAEIYRKILIQCNSFLGETGGYLGIKENVICEFVYDPGVRCENTGMYRPNIDRLRTTINDWINKDILLCGIIHTHLNGNVRLSTGDYKFIKKFMILNREIIKAFYFPIIIPKKTIMFYKVEYIQEKILVQGEELIIV